MNSTREMWRENQNERENILIEPLYVKIQRLSISLPIRA